MGGPQPQRLGTPVAQKSLSSPQPGTPQGLNLQPALNPALNPNANAQQGLNVNAQLGLQPYAYAPPPKKQWYDKLADALLGDDGVAVSGAFDLLRFAFLWDAH